MKNKNRRPAVKAKGKDMKEGAGEHTILEAMDDAASFTKRPPTVTKYISDGDSINLITK